MKIEQEKEIRDHQAEKAALETQTKDLLDKLRRLERSKRELEQTASTAVAVRTISVRTLELEVFVLLYFTTCILISCTTCVSFNSPPHQTSLSEKAAHESEKQELEMTVENLQFEKQEMKNNLDRSYRDIDRLNESAEMTREDNDLQVNAG